MSVDVREISLHDAVKFIVDNRGKTVPTADNGIPLIATNCIKNNGLFPVFEKIRFVSEETYKTWFRSHPEPGDIIFVNKGTPGRVCLVPNPVNFCIAQDMVALRVDESVIYPKYLFAALRSDYIQNVIENMHVGTLIPHFKKSDFERLMIPVPDEVTQKYIGNLYYDLSMAIELNNQINKTLEEMAQAIFKSWFVDFEPFKDGEFEESELGLIPKGWRVGAIDELIKETISGDWGKETPQGNYTEKVICIRGADIPDIAQGRRGNPATRYILKRNLEKKRLSENEIIIEISGGSPTQSTGRTVFITKELINSFQEPIICTNFCRTVRLKEATYSSFVYSLLQYLYNEKVFFTYENGTTGIKNLDITTLFGQYKTVIPSEEVFAEYHSMYSEFLRYIYESGFECKKLSEIRDTLLPKLISGEIRVPVEEVV